MTSVRHTATRSSHQMLKPSASYVTSLIFNLRPFACNMAAIQPVPLTDRFQETLCAS